MWRTTYPDSFFTYWVFISIHVPRVEDDWIYFYSNDPKLVISIHVPRVEDDVAAVSNIVVKGFISIHVPRVEDDAHYLATQMRYSDFNPRPPCGGRHTEIAQKAVGVKFQSTSPVWRTTSRTTHPPPAARISIHVPRVEDDDEQREHGAPVIDFNPRPPCGGRHTIAKPKAKTIYFNPRPPCGGRLDSADEVEQRCNISIHVPRVEDDV